MTAPPPLRLSPLTPGYLRVSATRTRSVRSRLEVAPRFDQFERDGEVEDERSDFADVRSAVRSEWRRQC